MKFLLELVTCYGSSSTDSEVRQPAEESRSLVASGARRRVGGKRGKVVGVKSAGFNKNLKRKVGSKYQDPSYCDDSRRASISATVPAFSPTAFLF
ncbi:uncharacterized protein LOC111404958 isoform X2 [Olea europaea var. sylvestris]|uniref:uncharacterized protein LOC111404958 isoform X2 n=1 Tax=Olea europaea var. sylvestris TaxID=158386 RepID=UPI000C1D832A|nr:uncharacterized protein LOC111404958 isoform X2 [Olea europaea var. sylvestris]